MRAHDHMSDFGDTLRRCVLKLMYFRFRGAGLQVDLTDCDYPIQTN